MAPFNSKLESRINDFLDIYFAIKSLDVYFLKAYNPRKDLIKLIKNKMEERKGRNEGRNE